MRHPGQMGFYQKRFWPSGDLDLLVRVAFLPEREAAECWALWKRRRDLDSVTWEEHKVFARLAPRLAAVAPECSARPRLEGLVKSHWTRCQLMWHASARALDVLAAHDIPVMLLKGGALHTNRHLSHGPRITSDLDVLVPRHRFPEAMACLYADGWRSNRSVEFLKGQWRFGPGMNLRKAPHADVDVHHQPVHGPQLAPMVLDALWQRARSDTFLGRSVQVPTAEDLLVFTAAHATHPEWSRQIGAAWVFDLAALLQRSDISVEKVAERAREFRASPALLIALTYLHRLTGDIKARELVDRLTHQGVSAIEHWQFFLQTPTIKHRRGKRWWRRLRRLGGMEYESDVVPGLGQINFPARVLAELPQESVHDLLCTRHTLSLLPPPPQARALVVELAFDPPRVSRYKFEISVDGEALALFTTSASRIQAATEFRACVRIPLSLSAVSMPVWTTLAIESVNLKVVLPADATLQQRREASPPAFRVCRALWV